MIKSLVLLPLLLAFTVIIVIVIVRIRKTII